MKKRVSKILAVAMVATMVTCGSVPVLAEETVDVSGKFVGLSMHFLMDDYAKFFVESFGAVLDEAGVEYEITDANANAETQLNDVTNFYTKEVDGLVIVPFDENAVRDICNEIADTETPVVAVTYMPDTDVVGTVPGGDYENGVLAGELMIEKMGNEGKVYIFDTPIVAYRMSERIRGFRDALADTNIKIDSVKNALTSEEYLDLTVDILNSDPDVTGFYCNYGVPAIGCGTALEQLGRTDLTVVGIDADYAVMELIQDGWIQGAAAQYPAVHGQKAAEMILQALRGEDVEQEVEIPHGIVTAENAAEMCKTLWDKEL